MRYHEIRVVKEEKLNGLTIMSLDEFVNPDQINEADDFGMGSKNRKPEPGELEGYLDRKFEKRVKPNMKISNKDKYNMPLIHASNVQIIDGDGERYDMEALKREIMTRPDSILEENEKMRHSKGMIVQYYNIGLPAIKGLAVNEKTNEFVIVDTCPGAGVCKTFCYATKGGYVQYPAPSMRLSRMLNFLLNDPKGFENQLKSEISSAIKKKEKNGVKVVIRWHDAGDFFSPEYMNMAYNVARAFPNNEFYAYTKMASVANSSKPANFKINFSSGAQPREEQLVNLAKIKFSVVVPKEMFWDLTAREGNKLIKSKTGQLQMKSPEAWDELKDKLCVKYKIKKDTILTYDEYMQRKMNDMLGDKNTFWNVIVPSGAGDNSANDALVHGTLLLAH